MGEEERAILCDLTRAFPWSNSFSGQSSIDHKKERCIQDFVAACSSVTREWTVEQERCFRMGSCTNKSEEKATVEVR